MKRSKRTINKKRLDELKTEIERLSNQLANAEAELFDTQVKIISEFFGQKMDPFNTEIGVHECKDSPIETCFYDQKEDPALDDCLICSLPDERK